MLKTIEQLVEEKWPDERVRSDNAWVVAAARQHHGWAIGRELDQESFDNGIAEVMGLPIGGGEPLEPKAIISFGRAPKTIRHP